MNEYFLTAGTVLSSILQKMRAGSDISVIFEDQKDAWRTAKFSLRGLTATLLWIDEQQDRVGTSQQAAAPTDEKGSGSDKFIETLNAGLVPQDIRQFHGVSSDCEGGTIRTATYRKPQKRDWMTITRFSSSLASWAPTTLSQGFMSWARTVLPPNISSPKRTKPAGTAPIFL